MHFIHKILYFEEFLHKIALFFKNLIFSDFRLIELVARPIEIVIKNLVWICSFRLVLDRGWINRRHFRSIESNFRSIENPIECFLKPWVFMCSITIQTISKLFLSLSLSLRSVKDSKLNFLSFSLKLFARFLSSKASKTLLPLIFIYLHVSCIFSCILGKFQTFENLGILMFSIFSFKID